MRAKRSKKYRKIMEQYGLTFGFREPYQVLGMARFCPRDLSHSLTILPSVDSHHLRTTHAFKMPLNRYLENTLHGKVKPFITKCTLASILQTTDLHTSRRPDFLPPPTDLPLRHCSHVEIEGEEGVLSEEECLLDLLSGGVTGNQQPKNRQHFVLATADPLPVKEQNRTNGKLGRSRRLMSIPTGSDIRAHAREIPGVPIIYVKRSVMILEELSGPSLGVRRREEKDKFREGLLGTESRKRKRDEDEGNKENEGNVAEAEEAAPKKKKLKKVRGPNPLSVLKKKSRPKAQVEQPQPRATAGVSAQTPSARIDGASAEEGQPRAKRKRKHGKKRDSGAGGDAGHHDICELGDGMSDADEG
jgi:U3 small nucleolar RNA-associated protein 23